MARAATTSDVFNAVAEPRRRQILNLLQRRERSVNDLAHALRVQQPQASKHLRVLKQVGLVNVRGAGQQRLYTLNSEGLKPIHDWVMTFARFRSESFERLDQYLQDLQTGKKKP
jgi:DNA-binding transcriptional ArsR family regulator